MMTEQKHILVISQYFYPEPFRINDICQEWIKRGYTVTVLTGIPNYPEGKFYKGYGLFKKRKENWNGINVIRIPQISRGKSALRLVCNYYSFVVSGFLWNLFTRLRADCVFTFEVSPMIQAKVGVWYARKHKVPHYLYVQDLWPDNLEVVGGIHNRLVLAHYAKMCQKIYDGCDKIFATSPSFVETIKSRICEGQDKVLYWPQYAEEFYVPQKREIIEELPSDDKFKIVFTGNIGYAQGLDVLPQTAAALKSGGRDNVQFVIVGDGRYKAQLIRDIDRLQVSEMFHFIPRQPAQKIPAILAACDVAFLSFMASPLFEQTIPAKLQSYMACGMPILASAIGETQAIIETANCGYCCGLQDVQQLVDVIKKLETDDLKLLGKNALEYSKTYFDKSKLFDEMDTYLA